MATSQHETEPQSDRKRLKDLKRFYALLAELATRTHGPRLLSECTGRDGWPLRGVYFFQEAGEQRAETGTGLRIVRVGTHALKTGSKATLWKRLYQHKGQVKSGGGNHRGSIFRLLVGAALIKRGGHQCASWEEGDSAPKDTITAELPMERLVTEAIGRMPFLYLPVDDAARPASLRGVIERNAIALLSNYGKPAIDAPSQSWLGQHCPKEKVCSSGLWNQNHVDEAYDPSFLDDFREQIASMGKAK